MSKRILVLTLPLLLLLAGCKPGEVVTNNKKRVTKAESVLTSNRSARLEYETLSFKGKGLLKDVETNLSFTYKINVVKDSVIYASISKMGVTAYQVLADPDSVRIRKTLEKSAEICDYSLIERTTGFDLDFYDLQDVLAGDLVKLSDTLEFVDQEEGNYHFEGSYNSTRIDYYIQESDAQLGRMEVVDERRNQSSRLSYLEMTAHGKQRMPHHILFELLLPMESMMEFTHSKVEINAEEVRTNFRIPSSYEVYHCIR